MEMRKWYFKQPPWLRQQDKRVLDPHGQIILKTIEENEAMIRKYNQLVALGGPQTPKYQKSPRSPRSPQKAPPSQRHFILFNTKDIKLAIQEDITRAKGEGLTQRATEKDTLIVCSNELSGSEKKECWSLAPYNRSVERTCPPGFQPLHPAHTQMVQKEGQGHLDNPLEVEAIMEYDPKTDSRHDMIFGNMMGLHYGEYSHGPLWSPPQLQLQQPSFKEEQEQQLPLTLKPQNGWYEEQQHSQPHPQGVSGGGAENPYVYFPNPPANQPHQDSLYSQQHQCMTHHDLYPQQRHYHHPYIQMRGQYSQKEANGSHPGGFPLYPFRNQQQSHLQEHRPSPRSNIAYKSLFKGGGRNKAGSLHHGGGSYRRNGGGGGTPRNIWGDIVVSETLKEAALRCGAIQSPRGATLCVSEPSLLILHRKHMAPTGSFESLLEETKRQMIFVKRSGKAFDISDEEGSEGEIEGGGCPYAPKRFYSTGTPSLADALEVATPSSLGPQTCLNYANTSLNSSPRNKNLSTSRAKKVKSMSDCSLSHSSIP